jgi:hypothetical protein
MFKFKICSISNVFELKYSHIWPCSNFIIVHLRKNIKEKKIKRTNTCCWAVPESDPWGKALWARAARSRTWRRLGAPGFLGKSYLHLQRQFLAQRLPLSLAIFWTGRPTNIRRVWFLMVFFVIVIFSRFLAGILLFFSSLFFIFYFFCLIFVFCSFFKIEILNSLNFEQIPIWIDFKLNWFQICTKF